MNAGLAGLGAITAGTVTGAAMDIAASNDDQQFNSTMDSAMLAGSLSTAAVGSALGLGYGVSKSYNYLKKDDYANAKKLGKKGLGVLEKTGYVMAGAAKGVAEVGLGLPVGIGDSLVGLFEQGEKKSNSLGGLKLNKKGKIALGIVGLGLSMNDAIDTYDEIQQGTPSGFMTSTPVMEITPPEAMGPSTDNWYSRSAEAYGAGGDLVFALNANRRG